MACELRSKTKKAFPSEMEQTEIELLIGRVCNKPEDEVREVIWQLTYKPQEYIYRNTLISMDVHESKILILRGELINQYRKVNPGFGYQQYNTPKEGESEAIKKLRQKAGGDGVIMYEVMKRVNGCVLDEYLAAKYSSQLRSDVWKLQRMALKSIQIKEEEIFFFIRYADVIADLLERRVSLEANA